MSRFIKEGEELVLPLLKMVNSTADVFPPLKSATGAVLYIVDLVQKFKSNRKEWSEFGEYIQETIAAVVYFLPQLKEQPDVLRDAMDALNEVLVDIRANIENIQGQSWLRRVSRFLSSPEEIDEMKKKLDDVSKLFLLTQSLSTGINVVKLFGVMDTHLASINYKMNQVADTIVERVHENSVLSLLPYAEGASWDSERSCLPNTRETILADIWTWINNPDPSTPPIFWLSGVAGSGKSAIAHSVAQRCAHKDNQANLLLSCFFFTLDKPERNSTIFSTIATDLRRMNKEFAAAIADAIEADRSLPSASISRQFEHILLNPSLSHPPERPVVIVIDALDEGYSEELLKLLRNEFHKLPSKFRVFVTSRSDRRINNILSKSERIHKRFIDIHEYGNSADIAVYSRHRFKDVASLKEGWPDSTLLDDFTKRADGLFLWAATVLNFLKGVIDPESELQRLLYEPNPPHLSSDDKMNKLYSTILSRCNWQDRALAEGYIVLMGAILAAKEPLSINAWQSLYPNVRVKDILLSVGSLLSGVNEDSTPVRILHQSFRDFSTSEHQSRPSTPSYYIDVSKHSDILALLCLRTLNKGLAQEIQGLGFLDVDSEVKRIPSIPVAAVPEELRYACRYWMDHLADVDAPMPDLVNTLELFLKNHVINWMELSAANGRFQNLEKYWEWSKTHVSPSLASPEMILDVNHRWKVDQLSESLSNMDRRQEALLAIEEVVAVFQIAATKNPKIFNFGLASSLHNLSSRLSDLGRNDQALERIQEAAALNRELANQYPEKFNPLLAGSLNNLSSCLATLGRTEQALEMIQEAVTLHQVLASQYPEKYNPDLAVSLNNLSSYLSELGHPEQALEMVQEATALYQVLANQYPEKYNPDLAWSLNNLSSRLSGLGHPEQALEMIQEAAALYRELANQYPEKYNPLLAASLNNLSSRLSDLGHPEQALEMIQEAAALRRDCQDSPFIFLYLSYSRDRQSPLT